MRYCLEGVAAVLIVLLVIVVMSKFIVLDTRQCDPVCVPIVQIEESVETASRYYSRQRVGRFFKRSRRA